MTEPNLIRLSDIIVQNPDAGSFQDLLTAIRDRAEAAGKAMLEIDIKPDYPDTPRNWEFQVESAFTWGHR